MRLVCVAISLLCLPGCDSSVSTRAKEEVGAAKAAMNRGSNEAALEHLDASLGIEPTAEAYLLRSKIQFERGKLGPAMQDAEAGLAIDAAEKSLLEQKKRIENALRAFDEFEKHRIAKEASDKAEAARRESEESTRQAVLEQRRLAKERHQELIDDLRFLLTKYDDYWASAPSGERESYIASIVTQGDLRLRTEIAGRKAYWEDRYRSSEEPGTPENEEKKARGFIEQELAK